MKTLRLFCALLLAIIATSRALHAAPSGATTLQAILVTASNDRDARRDPRLATYEATLRRVLRFESFTFQGSDTAKLRAGGSAELVIGQGHELAVQSGGESPYSFRIRWADNVGGRTIMNTGVTLQPGVPLALGGAPTGRKPGEVYAVILIAR